MVLVRQHGTRIHPGRGVGLGRDHTLYARKDGRVRYYESRNRNMVAVES
jgi:large subunit ribosomal protein L27